MMKRTLSLAIALAIATTLSLNATGASQSAQLAAAKPATTTLLVEVSIARYQGEKRLSNLPYSLMVNTDNTRSSLRMGGQVPIATSVVSSDGKAAPMSSYSYRDIGTSIDCTSTPVGEDGRYKLTVTVEESSVYPDTDAAIASAGVKGAPAFRSFRAQNFLSLRSGQSVEFTTATDRITSEVVKVTVKATALN